MITIPFLEQREMISLDSKSYTVDELPLRYYLNCVDANNMITICREIDANGHIKLYYQCGTGSTIKLYVPIKTLKKEGIYGTLLNLIK